MYALYSCSKNCHYVLEKYSTKLHNYRTVSAPSGAPEMFSADVGERKVVFSWSAPLITQQNGVITNYTLSCSPSPSSLPQSPSSGALTVTGLSPDTSYSCSLVASNSQGSGPPANISFTTQQDCESLFQVQIQSLYLYCYRCALPSSPEWSCGLL